MKNLLFQKRYDGESIVDMDRDLSEMEYVLRDGKPLPEENGFPTGTFVVSVVWFPDED